MIPFNKARQIAAAWVSVLMDDSAELVREAVVAKPYGWIFHYQSREYLNDRNNHDASLVGNAPFIVDRINGEVRVLGTGAMFGSRLAEYERSVPAACMAMRPEAPSW